VPFKPAAVSQKQIKPLVVESTQAPEPVALNKESSVKDADADGDYSEFTAQAMKAASRDASNSHTLTAEDIANITGDN
jgi:hypothetical protein